MSRWTCDLCPATGTEATPKLAGKAKDRHWYREHRGEADE